MNFPTFNSEFYEQDTITVAQSLIGHRLVSRCGNRKTSGIIVETEAYLAHADPACHGTRGQTKSNQSMFGQPGFAYVYPIHAGFCFNIVTAVKGIAEAVLVRALAPETGLSTMKKRREQTNERLLTTGPSRMCQALGVDRQQDGINLMRRRHLWVEQVAPRPKFPMKTTPRIGVTSGESLRLRFVWKDNPFVSGPKYMRT